jgi:hypothetical protein
MKLCENDIIYKVAAIGQTHVIRVWKTYLDVDAAGNNLISNFDKKFHEKEIP